MEANIKSMCMVAWISEAFLLGGITSAIIMRLINRRRDCKLYLCDITNEDDEEVENHED